MNNYINISNRIPSKELIQGWINEILKKYKQKVGFTALPICEKTLCKVIEELKGIRISIEPEKKASIFDEALLLPIQGGFIIKYGTLDKNQKKFHYVKIRETICHELAHILFYDCTSSTPHLKTMPPEYLCHDIARQLLLPEQIVKQKFLEKIKTNSNLLQIIEQISKDFQVALMLVVRRLTEDLSLLNDTMITFWKYKSKNEHLLNKGICYKDYRIDPKLSHGLRRFLPKYWCDRIHIEAWDKVVSKVAIGKANDLPDSLYVEGKKKKRGRIKSIPFKIQCSSLYNRSNNLSFGWNNTITPPLMILSVKKFDLNMLKNGK